MSKCSVALPLMLKHARHKHHTPCKQKSVDCCMPALQGASISPTLIVIGPYDTTVAGQVTDVHMANLLHIARFLP